MKTYTYNEIFEEIRKVVPASVQIYLIGGAVRDLLLGKPIKDYDFVIEGLVRPVGKKLADNLRGKYYVLDDDRDMVRVILKGKRGEKPICIDISQLRGESLEADLFSRDFTINAIAVDFLENNRFIDPLGGVVDLKEKRLRMCNLRSLRDDPLRGMRAIRMAVEFGMEIDSQLLAEMHEIQPYLRHASIERYRDEFFKILSLGKSVLSLQLLEKFGFMEHLFPSAQPYSREVLNEAVRSIDHLLLILTQPFDEPASSNLISGLAVLKLGNFRDQLETFYDENPNLPHNRRDLAVYSIIAAIISGFNEKGKPDKPVKAIGKHLLLSTNEISISVHSIAASVEFRNLATAAEITNYEIYQYFYHRNSAGVDGIFLSLALWNENLHQETDPDQWNLALDRAAALLDAWFNRHDELVEPKPLISGNEISAFLNIPESPLIGKIKDAVLKAQVNREINTVEEAKALASALAAQFPTE